MRIGLDCRSAAWYRGTGIGNYSYKLISNMISTPHHSYDLYTPQNSLKENFSDYSTDIDFHPIPTGSENGFWNKVNCSNYTLEKDLSLFHTPQNGIGLPDNFDCPLIITLHDIIPARMPETVSSTFNKMYHENIQNILDRSSGIITVSHFSKQDIIKEYSYPSNRIFVTHLASDISYKPLNKALSKAFIKNLLHIEEDYILYIGGFTPRKNILGIIKAYQQNFPKLKNKYKLLIAGKKGLSYSIYRDYVNSNNLQNHVIFTDFIHNNNLPFLYNAASLFMFPSFYEGFGLPPLEAMACGTPVIASNITSIPEVLKDGAVYVDPYDIDDIAKKMMLILNSPELQSNIISKGLAVNDLYSWKKTAAETMTAFKKIFD